MIAFTYAASGVLLALTAVLFVEACSARNGLTLAWSVVFFFASAAASSAYLTVSESFPLEMRALAIAVFYAFGTALGGVAGPWLFGVLIGTGERAGDRLGLRVRRGADADRRRGHAPARRGRRAPLARGRRPAALLGGLTAQALNSRIATSPGTGRRGYRSPARSRCAASA